MMTPIKHLPPELIDIILSYMTPKDQINFALAMLMSPASAPDPALSNVVISDFTVVSRVADKFLHSYDVARHSREEIARRIVGHVVEQIWQTLFYSSTEYDHKKNKNYCLLLLSEAAGFFSNDEYETRAQMLWDAKNLHYQEQKALAALLMRCNNEQLNLYADRLNQKLLDPSDDYIDIECNVICLLSKRWTQNQIGRFIPALGLIINGDDISRRLWNFIEIISALSPRFDESQLQQLFEMLENRLQNNCPNIQHIAEAITVLASRWKTAQLHILLPLLHHQLTTKNYIEKAAIVQAIGACRYQINGEYPSPETMGFNLDRWMGFFLSTRQVNGPHILEHLALLWDETQLARIFQAIRNNSNANQNTILQSVLQAIGIHATRWNEQQINESFPILIKYCFDPDCGKVAFNSVGALAQRWNADQLKIIVEKIHERLNILGAEYEKLTDKQIAEGYTVADHAIRSLSVISETVLSLLPYLDLEQKQALFQKACRIPAPELAAMRLALVAFSDQESITRLKQSLPMEADLIQARREIIPSNTPNTNASSSATSFNA